MIAAHSMLDKTDALFGLGGSAMVAYKLYLSVTSHQKKERKKTKQHISFNNHH